METVVALAIAAVALSFFVGAFAPATIGIKRASSVEDAKLLADALEAELNILRPSLDTGYTTSFEKAFDLVANSGVDGNEVPNLAGALVAFKYRADVSAAAVDGVYNAYTGIDFNDAGSVNAPSMRVQNRVTTLASVVGAAAGNPVNSVEGNIFLVALRQIVRDPASGTLTVSNPGGNLTDSSGGTAGTAAAYLDPVILVQADFFVLESNSPGYLRAIQAGSIDLPSRPIYSTKFGITR